MTLKFWANFNFDRKLANYVFKKINNLNPEELNDCDKVDYVILWIKDKIKKDEEFIKKINEKINKKNNFNKKHVKIGYLRKEEDKIKHLEKVWENNDVIIELKKIIIKRNKEISNNKMIINKMEDFLKKNISYNI